MEGTKLEDIRGSLARPIFQRWQPTWWKKHSVGTLGGFFVSCDNAKCPRLMNGSSARSSILRGCSKSSVNLARPTFFIDHPIKPL